ncbi:hypothetical protein S7711_01264 [Stachybotrys chartarum IBT 7711]|uniref:Uncharacterized protein n=1 Tax=Stachybotrys chartarum (strain CBS 109288 / IBT 7711) TaxID=1280523 RepID=A0A084BBH7_STACB|nr:hypothetical protein S7711_01264 [Stachybotrys chartarum IBT 7711]KFA78614.1 hypothetical protein S40288_06983 [Stachybotrys chartarum IBT 40288]
MAPQSTGTVRRQSAQFRAAPSPTVGQLEQAALHILRLICDVAHLENTTVAIIGDLAVCKYLPNHSFISSIDFIISKSSSPARVTKDLLGHPMSPLVDKSGDVYYQHPSGWEVEVKLIPDWVCPYLPTAARPAGQDPSALPYISLEDLIVFKVDACGLRESLSSKRQEACEAAALLHLASEHAPLILEASKLERIEQDLSEVVQFCSPENTKAWWQLSLGIQPDHQRSTQEIFSELSDHVFSRPSTSSPVSNNSSISRSSSYMSSTSSASTSSSVSSLSSESTGRPHKMSSTGNAALRHKRGISTGGTAAKMTLDAAMQQLHIERSKSPGVALTVRI